MKQPKKRINFCTEVKKD